MPTDRSRNEIRTTAEPLQHRHQAEIRDQPSDEEDCRRPCPHLDESDPHPRQMGEVAESTITTERTPLRRRSFFQSGHRESNPAYVHPMHAYCRYTTPRNSLREQIPITKIHIPKQAIDWIPAFFTTSSLVPRNRTNEKEVVVTTSYKSLMPWILVNSHGVCMWIIRRRRRGHNSKKMRCFQQ